MFGPSSLSSCRGAKTAYIAPGSPWENGYIESFNARLRDALLDGEIFYTLRDAQIVIESWRRHYNGVRRHAPLGNEAPTPEVFVPAETVPKLKLPPDHPKGGRSVPPLDLAQVMVIFPRVWLMPRLSVRELSVPNIFHCDREENV